MTSQENSIESGTQPNEVDLPEGLPAEAAPDAAASTLAQCLEIIAAQAGEIAQLREEMALLQERLKLDSRNSSKPPSSNGPGSGGNRAQRRASERACTRSAEGPQGNVSRNAR